jgi:hypothetical protein
MSRLAPPTCVEVFPSVRPFSNFDFVDDHFEGSFPIRRLFSQARSRGCQTVVVEHVPAAGAVADENAEIAVQFPDYTMRDLRRISFWSSAFTDKSEIAKRQAADCIGFAILKHDLCVSRNVDDWQVFESVIVRYGHEHNYVPTAQSFKVSVHGSLFQVSGVLYCQQNGLNKACAQVALRSVCATYLKNPDLSFRQINDLAFHTGEPRTPWKGLDSIQIQRVLEGLGIPHFAIYYPARPAPEKWRAKLPYQKIVYAANRGLGSPEGKPANDPRYRQLASGTLVGDRGQHSRPVFHEQAQARRTAVGCHTSIHLNEQLQFLCSRTIARHIRVL